MSEYKTALVTGASGFVGRHVSAALKTMGYTVRGFSRSPADVVDESIEGDLADPHVQLDDALKGIDAVVHCAARVHVLKERASDPLEQFRAVNTRGTARLAEASVNAGVRRFVFVSTIGVHGATSGAEPIRETSPCAPHSPYAVSKLEAEQLLIELASRSALECVIVRPPLVYGPDQPGNMATLMKLVERRVPLPVGAAKNRRSLISAGNLASFLALAVEHPAAAGEEFVVSDRRDVSTPDIVRAIAKGKSRRALLVPVPVSIMRTALRVVGRERAFHQLFASLQVDSSKAKRLLDWDPLESPSEALVEAARQTSM